MLTWYDVTLQDLTLPEGGFDQDLIKKMNLVEYLDEVEDLIRLGINNDPGPALEQIENVFMKIFMESCRVVEDRYPEPEEITAYLQRPDIAEEKQNLLYLAMHVDEDSWPRVRKALLKFAGVEE